MHLPTSNVTLTVSTMASTPFQCHRQETHVIIKGIGSQTVVAIVYVLLQFGRGIAESTKKRTGVQTFIKNI